MGAALVLFGTALVLFGTALVQTQCVQ